MKFIIKNNSDQVRFILHPSDGHISGIYLYKPELNTYRMTSAKLHHPEDGREVFNRIPAFFIELKKNETKTFFLKINAENEIVNFSYIIESENSYVQSVQTDYLIIGLYLGALLIIIAINIFYYVSLKDPLFLFYAIYVCSSSFLTAALDGFIWLLIPNADIAYHTNYFIFRLWPDCLLIFSSKLVNLKENNKKLYQVCCFFIIYHTIIMALLDCFNVGDIRNTAMAQLETINWSIAILLISIIIILSYKNNRYLFKYYLIAYGILLLVTVLLSMHSFSAENWYFFEHGVKAGTLVEMITLSFAVSRRFKLTEEDLKKKKDSEKNLTDKVSQLQMDVRKAQMNPHFMFNALTSIQYFIMKHNATQAKNYLEKFALLMRLTLDNSRNRYISLFDELNALTYYIELEFLRLKTTAHQFEIKISADVNPHQIHIPALLIQPFVENAIWHGLQYKTSPGKLIIHIDWNGNELECTVEDDGVGPQPKKKEHAHKSSGIQITKERFTLIHSMLGSNFRYDFIDLRDDSKNTTGVKVLFNLPYIASQHIKSEKPILKQL